MVRRRGEAFGISDFLKPKLTDQVDCDGDLQAFFDVYAADDDEA